MIATDSLAKLMTMMGLPESRWVAGASLLLVLAAEILVAIFGHATIMATEEYLAVLLVLLFIGFAFMMVPHLDPHRLSAPSRGGFSAWLLVTGLIFSYPLSWTNFASDYSRYLPERTSWQRVAWAAGGGQFVALVFCEIIGVLFALALGGALTDPVADLPKLLPQWYLLPFLVAVILGSIAANVPNGYTAGLGLLALRLPMGRVASMLVIAAATVVFRVFTLLYGHAIDLYERWLGYIVFWTGPWISIVVVDFFLRGGTYSAPGLMQWGGGSYWYARGVRWQGVAAFLSGLAASVLFSDSDLYASPLMTRFLGGTDVSFEAGIVVAGTLYFWLSRGAAASAWPIRDPGARQTWDCR